MLGGEIGDRSTVDEFALALWLVVAFALSNRGMAVVGVVFPFAVHFIDTTKAVWNNVIVGAAVIILAICLTRNRCTDVS